MPAATSEQLSAISVLTPREREVMYYIALGKLNKVIAADMDIKQRTVEAHRAKIFHKLKVRNAVGLVHYLLDNNIELTPPVRENQGSKVCDIQAGIPHALPE